MSSAQPTWELPTETTWRPLAHVAIRDDKTRFEIAAALRAEGWAVVDSKTGYHLLQSLSGPLFDEERWCRPRLVVVEAVSPGCSGYTIAFGLRDIDWSVATVVITDDRVPPPVDDDIDGIYLVDRTYAPQTVLEVARKSMSELAEISGAFDLVAETEAANENDFEGEIEDVLPDHGFRFFKSLDSRPTA